MRLIATRQGLLSAPAAPAPAARRSWLKGLGATLGASLLGRPAQASPTRITSTSPYVGEIMLVGFNFVPQGWLECDGSLQSISDYDTLFTLIGTTYGGDGQNSFALPDLRGRAPMHQGNGYQLGQVGGQETTTLTVRNLPTHTHPINNSVAAATSSTPTGLVPAVPSGTDANGETVAVRAYDTPANLVEAPSEITTTGSSAAAIELRSGLLVMRYCISVYGIFPSM
ncbi:MAG: phage tail protein [Janthinobacterium lividum]